MPVMANILSRTLLRSARYLDLAGLTWFAPLARAAAGDRPGFHLRLALRSAGLPLLAIGGFLMLWQLTAGWLDLGGMKMPTPGQVLARGGELVDDWRVESARYAVYEADFARELAANPEMSEAELRGYMPFEAKRTFVDQILTSLKTVFTGVALAVLIAVPIGVLCGLSGTMNEMATPLIQLFKPVSPLAWFPIVFIVANKLMGGDEGFFAKSFVIAATVVCLCSIWPTLINSANGVANVDRDFLNVAKVLRLSFLQTAWRIVLPAALPAIFTGIRLSLGIGWMVLIAAEMMAVSPGLGGFIWDWYQSSNDIALAYLLLAVLVIGATGFVLDRAMIAVQRAVSHGGTAAIR